MSRGVKAGSFSNCRKLLNSQISILTQRAGYRLHEAQIWFVGLFFMTMIICWQPNSRGDKKKPVREDIRTVCVFFKL